MIATETPGFAAANDIPLTPRVHALKESILNARSRWITERGRLYTEAFREHEARAVPIKRALALAHLLDRKTIFIQPEELVVGNYAAEHGCYELYPEYSFQDSVTRYIHFDFEREIDESYFAGETEKREFREMAAFWKGRCMRHISDANIPKELQRLRDLELCCNPYGRDEGQGHVAVEYDRVVREGVRPTIDRAKARLLEVAPHDPKAYQYLQATVIALEAFVRFARRFATLAQAMAEREADPARREELRAIADTCLRVPERGAEDFRQAVQAVWFVHLCLHLEQNGFSISLGRLDQYLYPLYRRDLERGAITREQALELIEALYVKCMEITIGGIRISLTQTVTLCGRDLDGRDMTNDLSLLCIEADRATRMVQPSTMIRWHKNLDPRVMRAVVDATYKGDASIAFINDEVIIPGLVRWGVKPEDAAGYAQCGCNETEIPGKMIGGGLPRPIFLLRTLLVALHGGRWPETGERVGVPCKALGEYASFDEIGEAFRAQYEHFARQTFIAANLMDLLHAQYAPLPFASSLMHGTIERGRDLMEATEYFYYAVGCNDFVAALNSMVALKKCVFDDRTVTQQDLAAALEANFAGHDRLRRHLLDAPKFGNDDDGADAFVEQFEGWLIRALEPYRSFRNNAPAFLECIPRISHVYEGLVTPATPDGRLAGETLPPGISAQIGTDREGPTALLNSFTKVDPSLFTGGVVDNIRFHPSLMKDESARAKAGALVDTYFARGGIHLQMNCVRGETLRDAQKHPEKYRDLMVRVSGYVDYFTNMDAASQEDIIRRTEQTES